MDDGVGFVGNGTELPAAGVLRAKVIVDDDTSSDCPYRAFIRKP